MAKNYYEFSFALGMEAIAFFVLGLENDNKKTKAESLPPCFWACVWQRGNALIISDLMLHQTQKKP
jgi:hypothetical protein